MTVLFFVLGYILGAVGMLMLLSWYGKKYHGKKKEAGPSGRYESDESDD